MNLCLLHWQAGSLPLVPLRIRSHVTLLSCIITMSNISHGPVTQQVPCSSLSALLGLPRWLSGKESTSQCRRCGFSPWVGKIPWRRKWQPTPVFLAGKSHGQRSLEGYSTWGCKESDRTEWLNDNNNNILSYYWNITTTLMRHGCCCYPHFIVKEIETQRGWAWAHLRVTSERVSADPGTWIQVLC